MSLEISESTSRFVAAPDGVMLPVPNWVRDPDSGETIHIPMSARCVVSQPFEGRWYTVSISCRGGLAGETDNVARGTVHGTSMGGVKILARIASLGPVAGRVVAQLVGRAVSGVAASLLFPSSIEASDRAGFASHGDYRILYMVFP